MKNKDLYTRIVIELQQEDKSLAAISISKSDVLKLKKNKKVLKEIVNEMVEALMTS